ncbi:peptidoglycan glycosyltransferase [Bacillus mangrovi]|uniref:Peptidoglycan glycosyltransferase n=2 Tax=Metabacillus mangrovi TaxID=1491830 RepID=A0A7X2S367_9BACI|nr:peptidoglycan glycosyltransferase [Metabacillus mangrovi]
MDMEKWISKIKLSAEQRSLWARRLRITYGVVWNITLIVIILLGGAAVFAASAGAGYFASLVKDEEVLSYEQMRKDIGSYEETTEVYFAGQELAGSLRTDLFRTKTSLENISPHLINAVIATEDEFFYEHDGIVPKAIFRAIYQEFSNASMQSGGSTLTQQLIKNQILTNEVSFDRKAKEILLALRLERFFEKDEILEAYLNMADFGRDYNGRNIAGAETAARGLFGVSAKELTLPQAAFIAGLPQSPFAYTPYGNDGKLKQDLSPGISRMKTVLNRMLKEKFITVSEYEHASEEDIASSFIKSGKKNMNTQYPFLTDEVEKRAKSILMEVFAEKDGYVPSELTKEQMDSYLTLADRALRQNGYRIHTTIHKGIYESMQKAAKEYKDYGEMSEYTLKDPDTGKSRSYKEPLELGGMLIENKTGKILSFVGGRDHSRSQVNHFTSLRPIGSTMKPLLFYAPAIEEGFLQPGSYLADIPNEVKENGEIWPQNSDGQSHGLVSARTALSKSYNQAVVNGYSKFKSVQPVNYLYKMGITSILPEENDHLSLPLGGGGEITVEENVNAYTVFANNGQFADAYLIDSIQNSDGTYVYQHEQKSEKVFSPQTAYLTVDMMRDVLSDGTARRIPGLLDFEADWAGKTGTTQDTRDAWFVGSNPNITFGTWIGYDHQGKIQTYKGKRYNQRSQEIWAALINAAYKENPDLIGPEEPFRMPEGIAEFPFCALTGGSPTDLCRQAGFVESDLFHVKYAPEAAGESLKSGKYVLQKGIAYEVPASAPEDFIYSGPMMSREILSRFGLDSPAELYTYTKNLRKLVVYSGEKIEEDGMPPSPVAGVRINGAVLNWNKSAQKDLLGYRVYMATGSSRNYTKIASISISDEPGITLGSANASYYVTAVDAAGKESAPSTIAVKKP